MIINKFVNDQLVDVLNKYSEGSIKVGSMLRQAIDNSQDKEMIVPVLGMQGLGKSTLINALLRENILPSEVNETTCVPVEVKYGEEEKAEVHFENKSDIVIVHTQAELADYVDNNFNPANKKGVERIVLFRKIDLLKSGLIVVDLPGVGSLTIENENTTKRYIENLCTAIFVIPIVPTMRKTERMFIKGAWSQFSTAIFVKNRWAKEENGAILNGESDLEVKESVSHDKKELKMLAGELQNKFSDDDLIVVNAYKGIYGALNRDEIMIIDSNIELLKSKLEHFASNWESEKAQALMAKLEMGLLVTKRSIEKLLKEQALSAEDVKRKRKEEYDNYIKVSREINNKVLETRQLLNDKEEEAFKLARTKSEECAGSIRARVYQVIDKGVVDGPKLSEAFNDIQEDEMETFFETFFDIMQGIRREVEGKFNEIQDIISSENDFNQESFSFNRNSTFKPEKGAEPVGVILGGVVGMYVLVPLLGSNPAGWAVAGVLAASAIVFSLAGRLAKKMVMKGRINNAKSEISPIIDEIESTLRKTVREKYEEVSDKIRVVLDSIISARRDEERRLHDQINTPVNTEETAILIRDLEYVEQRMKEIQNHE